MADEIQRALSPRPPGQDVQPTSIEEMIRQAQAPGPAEPTPPTSQEALRAAPATSWLGVVLAALGDTLHAAGARRHPNQAGSPVAPDLIRALQGEEMNRRLAAYRTKKAEADAAANQARAHLAIALEEAKNKREFVERAAAKAADETAKRETQKLESQNVADREKQARMDRAIEAAKDRKVRQDIAAAHEQTLRNAPPRATKPGARAVYLGKLEKDLTFKIVDLTRRQDKALSQDGDPDMAEDLGRQIDSVTEQRDLIRRTIEVEATPTPGAEAAPAESPAAPAKPQVFASEAAARAAGKKAGDKVVITVNGVPTSGTLK